MKCPLCYEKEDKIKSLLKENQDLRDRLRKIVLSSSRGKDEIILDQVGTDWEITEHRYDKDSDVVKTIKHTIPEKNVKILQRLLSNSYVVGATIEYADVIELIIKEYSLNVNHAEFSGGINRSKIYFPLYYYPGCILERLGFIRRGSRGQITRLR